MNENKLWLKNIRILDILIFIFCFLGYSKIILESIIKYQKTYKNSFSVMYKILRNRYPFEVTLQNGKHQTIENYWQAYLESNETGFSCKIDHGMYCIKNNMYSQEIKLIDGVKGDIHGVFFEEDYGKIPIKNQIIIDVGANIGDSAIYFALKGAQKVIAIEPYPKNYELAKKNIELNNLQEKIKIVHAGCSNEKGVTTIDSEKEGSWAELTTKKNGTKVKLVTLGDIIKTNNIQSAILKMDCEGCEYDVIKKSNSNDFDKIEYAMIEYHYGYIDLKKKLESLGFNVKFTHPRFIYNFQLKRRMAIGFLFASKNKI
jgi:FkbM family methyltransferase